MANIFGIEVSGDTYDLEDSQARQGIQSNAQNIGNLATLETTDKDSVVDAVNELKGDIDDISVIGNSLVASGSVHPSQLSENFPICSLSLTKGKWLLIGFSKLNVSREASFNCQFYNTGTETNVRASAANGGGLCLVDFVTLSETKTVGLSAYAYPAIFDTESATQSATLRAVRIA